MYIYTYISIYIYIYSRGVAGFAGGRGARRHSTSMHQVPLIDAHTMDVLWSFSNNDAIVSIAG